MNSSWSIEGRLGLAVLVSLLGSSLVAAVASWLGAPPLVVGAGGLIFGLLLGLVGVREAWASSRRLLEGLEHGVHGYESGDLSLRLAVDRDDEIGRLVEVYNRIGGVLRDERSRLRQRELLINTVLETTPSAVLLLDGADRVLYANRSARSLLGPGELLGHLFAEIGEELPPALFEALLEKRSALITLDLPDGEEVFHTSRRILQLNDRRHVLLEVSRMTNELRRQEVSAWKKVIRVLSHELNNGLAPIGSLLRSAGRLEGRDDRERRLVEIHDTIADCVGRLQEFVGGYARFARLPEPRPTPIELESFLAKLAELEPFALEGELPSRDVQLDPAQMQQALLNLLRNAREAGSEDTTVAVAVSVGEALIIEVRDRGEGMDAETMASALLPFYSRKQGGAGLGLALSREIVEAHGGRISLAARPGGGLTVTMVFPSAL